MITLQEVQAKTLLQLVKEHKYNETIDHENCGVSLFHMVDIYRDLIGRELTKEEFKVFL